jgi:hypothetical protein
MVDRPLQAVRPSGGVVPEDIRNVGAKEYWKEFENRWTALLSYRYLGRVTPSLDAGATNTSMRLRHDMRNSLGGVMAAPLCIASPESGGMSDDEYVPNPVIASMQVVDDARGVEKIDVLSETIRIGRQMGFSRSRIVDAADHSRVIALSEGMGVSLGGTPEGFERVENPPIDIVDSPDLPRLHEVFGARRRDDAWILPELQLELASPDAALHLGPIHIVLETAAMEAAANLAGTDALQIEAWHVMFVARGKTGPFRANAEPVLGPGGRVGVRLSLHDEGNGDRVVTSASASFRVVN